ncbi:hypothetical protein [Rheinheimera sp. 1928-s]|uniref:hypothetical protein n=1 Tax=Rheinheimera sp. 1928-s TaxID=3033803 RepID=UPI00262BD547|nr:hypothetical protein [Rheinheimera sp. 1928-s]MDF3126808.1 hypothetical protein [Rheinheimera sp. 1928-s]
MKRMICSVLFVVACLYLFLNTYAGVEEVKQPVVKAVPEHSGSDTDIKPLETAAPETQERGQNAPVIEAVKGAAPEAFIDPQVGTLDTLLTEQAGEVYLDTKSLDNTSVDETRSLIRGLLDTANASAAAEIREKLTAVADGYQDKKFFLEEAQCSDKLCGLLFQAGDKESVNKALDFLSSSEAMKTVSQGGTLRIINEDGIYYGLIISSISGKPLNLR